MATGQNSMGFKFTNDKTNLRDYNNLSIRIMKNYDISSVNVITDSNNCLNFTPNAETDKSSYRIPAITFSPYSTIKQILSINIDKVSTTYTINNLHIVPVYPYVGESTQPKLYALAIEMNSYNSPLTDKLFIYIQIQHKTTSSETPNDILDTLLKTDLNQITTPKITLKEKYLDNLIPSKNQYYCQTFQDKNDIFIKNIFFDSSYVLYYSNAINLSTLLENNNYYTNSNSIFKSSITTGAICYKATPDNYKFINYIDVDSINTTSNLENDIYIDCQPVDLIDPLKENKGYLQTYSQSVMTTENIISGSTYFLLCMFVVLVVYFIFKIPFSFIETISVRKTPTVNP